jgi:hypothetical protein
MGGYTSFVYCSVHLSIVLAGTLHSLVRCPGNSAQICQIIPRKKLMDSPVHSTINTSSIPAAGQQQQAPVLALNASDFILLALLLAVLLLVLPKHMAKLLSSTRSAPKPHSS